jgi:acyl carrier protein
MVPSAFVVLDALPLTPSGKPDQRALPAPDARRTELEAAYVAPRSEPERALAAIAQALLQVEKVGLHDNFFDLGGHSLLLVKLRSQIQERFGREIPIVELFRYPTIGALAEYLERETGARRSLHESHDRAGKQRAAMQQQQQRMQAAQRRAVDRRRSS